MEGDGFGVNHTIKSPATTQRSYSYASRTSSQLGQSPGWVARIGNKMDLDLGENRDLAGVVTQARGNNYGPFAVTRFSVEYKLEGANDFVAVPGEPLYGPDVEFLSNTTHGWHVNMNKLFNAYFPQVIRARYVRFVIKECSGHCNMRAEVLLHISNDMFAGKHVFRRCLNTDRYTRVINVGALSMEEANQYSYTHPKHFVKSVDCPGCYSCREMPLTPNTKGGGLGWQVYNGYQGFTVHVSNGGQANAVLTVSLQAGLTWGEHNPEFLCRVDPRTAGPAEPDLVDDEGWTTFLLPDGTEEGGDNEGGDPDHDDVINAIAAGFHPPEAVRDLESTDQANLAAVYPPGAQVDPSITDGPWHSREADLGGWTNRTSTADKYTLPATTLDGGRGGGYWPPKPTLKVSFMPIPKAGEMTTRWYPKKHASFNAVTKLREDTTNLGWHIDSGAVEADHTHGGTNETVRFGWRCPARIGWFDSNWNEKNGGVWPSYAHGAAKDVGTYFQASAGAAHARCPDGRINAWEATVPNGVYTVTAGLHSNFRGDDNAGCTFENVRATGTSGNTYVYSVEVADGKFTLSGSPPKPCQAVAWLKLDLLSSKLYPKPWLPAPPKAWWQLELDDATADIGMVVVRLPHEGFTSAATYPSSAEVGVPDCRQWWLYAPAKCYRMLTSSRKMGAHPEMVTYPNFPGFTEPFLEWYFSQHDTDGNGELFYEEFRAAQLQQFFKGDYSMWQRPASANTKGTHGYHDDNAAHLWKRLNVIHQSSSDSTITKDEWVHGMLGQPRTLFCDLFASTRQTHGGNHGPGWCMRDIVGPRIPTHFGHFNDDGAHGFVVAVSDTSCTDQDGCPVASTGGVDGGASTNTTVCEFVTHRSSDSTKRIDCKGVKGKYIQISLPGDGQRLMPTVFVTAHRASVPPLPGTHASNVTASTNPKLQTVCYGVRPRPPPAADASDLLSAAKIHPKTIVDNNPEDPIFWSTCYDRVVIKNWLPLRGEEGDSDDYKTNGVPYIYKNGSYCLDCESVRLNYNNGSYDMKAMDTPRWWLQEQGQCQNCDAVVFDIHTSTTTTTSTSATSSTPTLTTTAVGNAVNNGGDGGIDTINITTNITTTINITTTTTTAITTTTTDVESATVTSLRAALASAGVDVSTIATILAAMQNTIGLAALATAAATDGLAAVLASDKFAAILAEAGLDASAVAAVVAAATAAEVDAVGNDGDKDAAPAPTKGNGGVVAGGILAALGVVILLVSGVMIYRDHQAVAGGSETSSRGSAGVSADVDAGAGAGTGSFYVAGGEAVSSGRSSFNHGNSLIGSASTSFVFANPVYDEGEANNNTNTNTNTSLHEDGWL